MARSSLTYIPFLAHLALCMASKTVAKTSILKISTFWKKAIFNPISINPVMIKNTIYSCFTSIKINLAGVLFLATAAILNGGRVCRTQGPRDHPCQVWV
jgi:hypothetical protein